ncbi:MULTISPECIES: glycerol-3-phosphate acyltransferase [unclassified Exiguobacterium]|uniref:glycerol-3-phosphate acyltransferase n=1 Tax=unclassified Exiguobacterium TaxID=2644629 RepID=UPI00103E9F87|nr:MULTISPECIES: glycerol-3-phosphate acyltransferase [unclassified Exiguobacterium]TCI36468.1 glycerol-3-phosphate acyltransferase [Exiguobacterium sp. SH4S7]TCI63416.1 glycerol-3-phosphate acyltransferase [Exiguobacterium sp. SH0S2]
MWIVVVGYLVGSMLGGRLYGMVSGQDLASSGSGNVGARNALRSGGIWAFLLVYGFDVLKTVLVLSLSGSFFFETALALTLGHIYPIWHIRTGGKGYAVFSGIILAYNPIWFVGGLLLLLLLIKITRNSRETGLVMLFLLPLAAWGDTTDFVLAVMALAVILYHHIRGTSHG